MSTVCNFITEIRETDCIGQSLNTINNNYLNTRNFICVVDNQLDITNQRLQDISTIFYSISAEQLDKAWVAFNGHIDSNGSVDGDLTPSEPKRLILNQYNVVSVIKNAVGDYTVSLPISLLTAANLQQTISKSISGLVINSMIAPNYIYDSVTEIGVLTYHPTNAFPNLSSIRFVTSNLEGNRFDPSLITLNFLN
jgi:hypothetical protein